MILVVTATANEMKAAFGFAGVPKVEQGEAVEFELNGHKLLLAVTGVGLVNAALAIGPLLQTSGLTGVVNLGIAGAYRFDEFPLCSTTYSWVENWPEYGLLGEDGGVDPKAIGFPQGEVRGEVIWNRVKLNPINDAEAMGLPLNESWLRASSVSVSSVTGTPTRAGWLKMSCGADVENMEGFALGYATGAQDIPFLEVRTISNLVGSREEDEWDLKGALAALETATRELFAG